MAFYPHMLAGTAIRRVAVLGGQRIPFARAHGAYAAVGNPDMLGAVMRAMVAKYQRDTSAIAQASGLDRSYVYRLMRKHEL